MKQLLFLGFLLCALSVKAQIHPSDRNILDSLLSMDSTTTAINYFELEVKKRPKDNQAYQALAMAYLVNQDYAHAEAKLRKALSLDSKCARCYRELARVYGVQQNMKRALQLIDSGIAISPQSADLYAFRGQVKLASNQSLGALLDINKAISLAPDTAEYYLLRAGYNQQSGFNNMALNDINKAIELEPDFQEALFERASLYYTMQQFDKSWDDVNKLLTLDSTRDIYYVSLGALQAVTGNYEASLESYSRAIQYGNRDYLVYLNISRAYYKQEDMDASCIWCQRADSMVKLQGLMQPDVLAEISGSLNEVCDSTKASYYYQRGVALYNLKQYQKAVDAYKKGLQKFPNSVLTLSFTGNAYMALGEFTNAIQYYDRALELQDQMLDEIRQSASFVGAPDQAALDFYKASLGMIYSSKAECLLNLGKAELALKVVDQAMNYLPTDTTFHPASFFNIKGEAMMALGKYKEALELFDKCVELEPGFGVAYVNKAIVLISQEMKVRYYVSNFNSNLAMQPIRIAWEVPASKKKEKVNAVIQMALEECDRAIKVTPNLGFAFLIRAQIKQLGGQSDYCMDVLKAKQWGVVVTEEELQHCLNK